MTWRDRRAEKEALLAKLNVEWPEVQEYLGKDYPPDRRVIWWTFQSTTYGLGVAICIVLAFASVMWFPTKFQSALRYFGILLGILLAIFASYFKYKLEKVKVYDLFEIRYRCRSYKFLQKRLTQIYEWRDETKPMLDKFLLLKPIIVDELGKIFVLYGHSNDLQCFYVVCDLYDDDDSGYFCNQENYDELVLRIVDERKRRRREANKSERNKRILAEFEAGLKG